MSPKIVILGSCKHGKYECTVPEKVPGKWNTEEGYKIATETRGEADAEVIKIYADAYEKSPEFYSFTKTLETYEKTIDDNTRLYLSTDSDYYKYINGFMEK